MAIRKLNGQDNEAFTSPFCLGRMTILDESLFNLLYNLHVKHFVVSNFDTVPRFYLDSDWNFTLYDQSSNTDIVNYLRKLNDDRIIFVGESSGHNLLNYLDFIIHNYEQLPDVIVFTKGNQPGRHCDENWFTKAVSTNLYQFLWEEEHLKDKEFTQYRIAPGRYLEINNSWYVKNSPHRYFVTFDDFCDFIFSNYRSPKFIQFSPGACYQVESTRITRNPKSFYQGLRKIIEYGFRPAECFMLERAMHLIFDRTFELRNYCHDLDEFTTMISHLPDKSSLKMRGNKTFREKFLESLIYRLEGKRLNMASERNALI